MKRTLRYFVMLLSCCGIAYAQTPYYLTAARLFDGERMQEGWAVVVEGNVIKAAGPRATLPPP
jgi:hypothetical protein